MSDAKYFTKTLHCSMCGRPVTVKIPKEGYEKWQAGELIQRAMPELSADDREMLKTQICSVCWEKMFGGM